MKFKYFIFLFLISSISKATHNRAGEITFKQIGINQYEITLITYTRIETKADRPIIEINWGDGTLDSLERMPGFPEFIAYDINKNKYKSTHTFPGPGVYIVYLEDPNRNQEISNIPNSVNVPFYIESKIIINPFLGKNNSPTLLNPPIEQACVNAIFQHNPSAYDEDGDSLVFSIIKANGLKGEAIPGYNFPDGVSINSLTGTLKWNKPAFPGEFNFAILIQEYRNKFLIGSIIRDMQVSVKNCNNTPPIITPIKNICVEAGKLIDFEVIATDHDTDQTITITASGGPLSEVSGDLAVFSEVLGQDTVKGSFTWQTGCIHVRNGAYQVFFKAQDNDNEVKLIDLKTLSITIIAPKVKNVLSQPQMDGVDVSWTRSICKEVIGYEIYRKNDSLNWVPDSCETGIPLHTGYKLIGIKKGRDNSHFLDTSVIEGNLYCYRIVALFPDGAKSIASEESCAKTIEISPIPTNVDVTVTDSLFGEIFLRWKNPINLDSLNFNGQLFYKVFERNENTSKLIYVSDDLNDTSFVQKNINTFSAQKKYYVELIEKSNLSETLLSFSRYTSSVFLSLIPSDRSIHLNWNYSTPWKNDTTVILINNNGIWEVIDSVIGNSFHHENLVNGDNYCFRVLTLGEYTANQSDTFLLNHSQEICEIPRDITPPCVPKMNAFSDCESNQNVFSWELDSLVCNYDLTLLNIFNKRYPKDDYNLLLTETSPWDDSIFFHDQLKEVAGCYRFSVIDSVGNESELTDEICFDNCPFYEIPNIFSPNGDNFNELLTPFPYRNIKHIDFEVYNRWGQIVYKTNILDILWDGKNKLTNSPCPSGVYFYKCVLGEIKLKGVENRLINGFIQLIRD